jgi:hypothetical protein
MQDQIFFIVHLATLRNYDLLFLKKDTDGVAA